MGPGTLPVGAASLFPVIICLPLDHPVRIKKGAFFSHVEVWFHELGTDDMMTRMLVICWQGPWVKSEDSLRVARLRCAGAEFILKLVCDCWVFVAPLGLAPVAVSGGLRLVVGRGRLPVRASLAATHRF